MDTNGEGEGEEGRGKERRGVKGEKKREMRRGGEKENGRRGRGRKGGKREWGEVGRGGGREEGKKCRGGRKHGGGLLARRTGENVEARLQRIVALDELKLGLAVEQQDEQLLEMGVHLVEGSKQALAALLVDAGDRRHSKYASGKIRRGEREEARKGKGR